MLLLMISLSEGIEFLPWAPSIISQDMTSIAARTALGMNMVMCSLKGEIVNFLETTMSMVIVGKKFGIYSDWECNLAISDLPFYL